MSPELTAALDELRALRLALAAETEARREIQRRLDAVTAERDAARATLAAFAVAAGLSPPLRR